jgi:tRNA(fMet)-specific endonuclease VapC
VKVAIDTNRYTDLARNDPDAVRVFSTASQLFIPFVVLAELRCGFALGRHGRQNEKALRGLLAQPGVEVLLADEQTTHHYASVYRQLREQGTPIPSNDMWIAALVLQHDLVLHARDRHFDHLPQIPRM